MKLIISGITCLSIMFAGSGFAASKQSNLAAKQAWRIAAENQLPPHQQRQKLDRYLHRLSTDELLAVVKSTGAEPALMRFARGDHARQADARLVKEPANEVELQQSAEMRHRIVQSLSSFLLNSRATAVSR